MIIPTAEYDPMFAVDDVPFREKMRQYIAREYADMLGSNANLLATDQGFDVLSRIYMSDTNSSDRHNKAA